MSGADEVTTSGVSHASTEAIKFERWRKEIDFLSITLLVILSAGFTLSRFASFAHFVDQQFFFALWAGLFWAVAFAATVIAPLLACLLLLFRKPVLAAGGFLIMVVTKPFLAWLWLGVAA